LKPHKKKAENEKVNETAGGEPSEAAGAEDNGDAGKNDLAAEDAPEANNESTTEVKYNDLLDRYQRSLAEFDNFRKRTNKEKSAMYDDGTRDTVEKLLPIVDNFERALNTNEDKENGFYKGVAMIARQLDSTLLDLGVELIPAAPGERFNPNVHFAVAHIEDDTLEENVIAEDLQKGYKHKDKIIRPSMVRVAN
jgi:molecular chaperone GrpE